MKKLYTIIIIAMLLCGAAQAQIDSLQQIPASVPYSCDFNNQTENARWILTRSGNVYTSYLNHFTIGSGTSMAGGTDKSLYISNDTSILETYGANIESSHYYADRIIDFDSVPQNYELELDWKASGYQSGGYIYGGLKVFLRDTTDLMPDGAPSYSTEYLELAVGDTGWRHIRVPLHNVSGLKTLQLYTWGYHNPSAGNVPAAIDNISITPSTCDAPQFTVTVDGAEAILNWQGTDTDTFLIIYRPANGTAQNSINEIVSGNLATITGLVPNTEYIVWMAKICDGDTSAMDLGTHFITGCGTYIAPFEEHFALNQHCWTLGPGFNLLSNSIYTTNFASYSSGQISGYVDTSWAISPVIDVSVLSNPYLKFSRMQNEYNGEHKDLALYYREYEADDWHYLGTFFTPTGNNIWKTDSLAIPSHSVSLQLGFFSIQHENQQLARISLDDIYVYDGTDCPPATDLVISGFNADTAFVQWIAGANMPYEVRYRTLPDTTWHLIEDLGGTAIIEPMASLTNYEVQVSPNCDLEQWVSCTFISPVVAVNLPYFTNFSDTADRGWQLDNGTCLNRWMMGVPVGWYDLMTSALFVTSDSVSPGYSLDHNYTTVLASKKFSMSDISTVNIEFDVLCGGNTMNYRPSDYLKVFFAPASVEYSSSENEAPYANDTAKTYAMNFQDYLSLTGEAYYPYKLNLTQDSVLHISAEMPNPTPNGEAQIVFVWRNDYSVYNDVQPAAIITNVHVWQPDCDVVSYLQVGDIVGGHATVSWVSPTVSENFVVEYKPHNTDWNAALTSTIDTNFLILNNLTPETDYDVRVRVNCGSVLGFGNWRYTSFNTACSIVVTDSTPYVMDFNGTADCWNLAVNPNHAWNHSIYSSHINHSYHESTSMGDTCPVYSPLMDISAVTTPYLKLTHAQSTQILGVAYRTSSLNPWQHLVSYSGSSATDSLPLPVSGPYIQLAFYATNNSWGYVDIDYVSVYNGPSCEPLTNLTILDVTSNAAAISWEGSNENGFVVRYRDISDTIWTYLTTTDTMFVINNLQSSTTYSVQVSGNCNEPNWITTQLSTTLTAVSLPYYTDFAPTSDRGWRINNSSCINYWTMGEVDDANHINALFITNDGVSPHYDNTAVTVVTAEKLFDVSNVDTLLVEFDLRIAGEGSYDFIKLFVAPGSSEYPASTNPDYNNPVYAKNSYSTYAYNFSGYNAYSSYNSPGYFMSQTIGSGFVHISAFMPNPVANNPNSNQAKVVFLWKNDHMWGTQPGAIITNISVRNPTCGPVSQLAVSNVLSTSAYVSWTPGNGGETDWILEYKETSALTWNQLQVSGTPACTLNGLTPSTNYDVRVHADCGNDQSIPTNTTFTTMLCDYMCPYMFVLSDSYGNGWDGGVMRVISDGIVVANLQAVNHHLSNVTTYDTVWVDLCHNAFVELSWDGGSYTNQCGITLTGPDGTQMYQQIGLPFMVGDTTMFSFTADCQLALPVVVSDSASDITQTEAVLNGHIADYGDLPILEQGFEFYDGSYTLISASGDTMAAPVTGLSPATTYYYRAFATTPFDTVYGNDIAFTTLEPEVPPCPAPTNLHVTDSSTSTLAIAWTETGDAEQWNIQYRAGSGQMSSDVSYATSYLITDLQPNTEYQIQVQSVCGVQTSEWTPVVLGKTTHVDSTGIVDYDRYVRVYPNPAGDFINVQCTMNNVQGDGMSVEVVDVYGKVVRAVGVETLRATSLPIRINVSGLAAGVYFVRVATEEGVITKPFVKK
ncbi:MAG: fibronectin type III domain-containing protein [Bacteroidales bacterium]|nr:fibronectin type III domain-containing protein [Bacteroidales bacterium]